MTPQPWGPIRQLAYIVGNLDESIQHWIALHGLGPWQLYRNTTMVGRYRGRETRVRMHVGLSYQDDLQIELIQVVSDTPSPYQDTQGRPLIGMHHIAWHSQDLDRDVALARARGLVSTFEAGNDAVRVAYLESPREPGPLYEFIEATPAILEGFAAGLQASRSWDRISAPTAIFDFEPVS